MIANDTETGFEHKIEINTNKQDGLLQLKHHCDPENTKVAVYTS